MKKQCSKVAIALLAIFAVNAALAAPPSPPPPPPPPPPCTLDSYSITAAALAGTTPAPIPTINATSCYGVVNLESGANPASIHPDNGNLGYLNDGLLNGENGVLPWSTFIQTGDLQDLNPATPGANQDPGWIQLGTMGSSTGSMTYSNIGTGSFNASQILNFSQTLTTSGGSISGTWSLTLDEDIISILHANGLFLRSQFDHLAFVVKSSDKWAVYDFNFNDIDGFDLSQPYSMSGTWNLNDFKNKNGNDQELSFLGVWARDPISNNTITVPEPGILALFGLGLLSLAGLHRRRVK